MKYHYNADKRTLTFCDDFPMMFNDYDIDPNYYVVKRWEFPEDLIKKIEDLYYIVKFVSGVSHWTYGEFSEEGDDLPRDIAYLVRKIRNSFKRYCRDYKELMDSD
jgi:hypothetical protein